jgi:type I restriction enzyme S subunit
MMSSQELATNNNQVPEGYKKTEVGVIPVDWDVKVLGKIVNFTNGKAHESDIKELGQYIVVNSKFISSEAEVKKYSDVCYCPTKKDSILMVMSDVPNGRAIAKCFLVNYNDTYTVNQRICSLEVTDAHPRFVFYLLNRNPFYLQFDDGVKQTNLRRDEVLGCPLPLPPLREQKAIAQTLSDVDVLIAALDKLIAKKRNIKTATMQQLLTGKTRLPGFGGEWEIKKLGELGIFSKGSGIRKNDVLDDGLPCIRYGEIYTKHNDYIKEFYSFISEDVATISYQLKSGDLLFAGSGETSKEIGKCVAFLGDILAYAGSDIIVFSPQNQDSLFFGYLMNYESIVKQKSQRGQGDAVVHIQAKNLAQLTLHLPPLPEQQAIAQVLSDMDKEIAALEKRRTKTQAIKQGMMQELLTGKTRLINN